MLTGCDALAAAGGSFMQREHRAGKISDPDVEKVDCRST
jgi:hypothetical protein